MEEKRMPEPLETTEEEYQRCLTEIQKLRSSQGHGWAMCQASQYASRPWGARLFREAFWGKVAQDWHISQTQRLMAQCGVPQKFLGARLIDFPEALHKKVDHGYYIHSNPGVGKTRWAAAMLRRYIIEKCMPTQLGLDDEQPYIYDYSKMPCFVEVTPTLLPEIKATWGGKSGKTELQILNQYITKPFLVLDDVGIEDSEIINKILYVIINGRDTRELPTIITSNMSQDQLAKIIDPRVMSRINGMCEGITLLGKDRRLEEMKAKMERNA